MTNYYAQQDVLYGGGEKIFSIPFPYLKKEHIKVFIDGIETTNFIYNNASQIQINSNIDNGQTVSIRRTTPIDKRMVVFTNNSMLDKDAQNLSADQLFYAFQEIADSFGVSVEEIVTISEQAQQLIEQTEGIIQQSQDAVIEATEQAEKAQQYAESVIFGLTWETIGEEDWVQQQNGTYTLTRETDSLVIGIYKGSWTNKEKVENVEIKVTAGETVLTALEAFNGFVLCGSSLPTSGSILPKYEEPPEDAEEGQQYYNTITKKTYTFNGEDWIKDADIEDLMDEVENLQDQINNQSNDLSEFHEFEDTEMSDIVSLIEQKTDNFIEFTD